MGPHGKTLREKVDEIHETVLILKERIGGGLGTGDICKRHEESLRSAHRKANWSIRMLVLAIGGGGVLLWLLSHNAIQLPGTDLKPPRSTQNIAAKP